MLNYAETTTISTIVPVTQPLQNQCQEYTPDSLVSMLSALFTHPEFQQGVRHCQDSYFDFYDEAPLTEEEMIWEIETNLSRVATEADKQSATRFGDKASSYLEKLGWVMGSIARGLTYTQDTEAQRLAL